MSGGGRRGSHLDEQQQSLLGHERENNTNNNNNHKDNHTNNSNNNNNKHHHSTNSVRPQWHPLSSMTQLRPPTAQRSFSIAVPGDMHAAQAQKPVQRKMSYQLSSHDMDRALSAIAKDSFHSASQCNVNQNASCSWHSQADHAAAAGTDSSSNSSPQHTVPVPMPIARWQQVLSGNENGSRTHISLPAHVMNAAVSAEHMHIQRGTDRGGILHDHDHRRQTLPELHHDHSPSPFGLSVGGVPVSAQSVSMTTQPPTFRSRQSMPALNQIPETDDESSLSATPRPLAIKEEDTPPDSETHLKLHELGSLPVGLNAAHSTDDILVYVQHEHEHPPELLPDQDQDHEHPLPLRQQQMRRHSEDSRDDVTVTFRVGADSPALKRPNRVTPSTGLAFVAGSAEQVMNRTDTDLCADKQAQWRKLQEGRFNEDPTVLSEGTSSTVLGESRLDMREEEDTVEYCNSEQRNQRSPPVRKSAASIHPVSVSSDPPSTSSDNRTHQVLVELHELCRYPVYSEHFEWCQTGRWVKYEECLELGSDRFGRPHVSTLSFHSLLELRELIKDGVISTNVLVDSYDQLLEQLVELMVLGAQIQAEGDAARVFNALLLDHKHVTDEKGPKHPTRQQSQRSLNRYFNGNASVVSPLSSVFPHSSPSSKHTNNGSHHSGLLSNHNEREPVNGHGVDNSDLLSVPVPMDRNSSNGKALSAGQRSASHGNTSLLAVGAGRNRLQSLKAVRRSMTDAARLSTRVVRQKLPALRQTFDMDLMRRLDNDCETAVCMVAKQDYLRRAACVLVRLEQAVHMPGLCELPLKVRFVFVLMGPMVSVSNYHELGRCMATLLANKSFQEAAYSANGHEDLMHAIHEFLDDSIVLPPVDLEQRSLVDFTAIKTKCKNIRERRKALTRRPSDLEKLQEIHEARQSGLGDPLRRTNKLFGGAVRELKQRAKHWRSDVTDACNVQCVLTIGFIFFTCFFPALTFGAILGETTQTMGVKETLLATSICGLLYAVFACQPVLLLGACGPMLAYETSVHQSLLYTDVDLLTARLWIAIWAFSFCFLLVAFEGSKLICYVTRFSDDILSALISVVFFVECFDFLANVFRHNEVLSLSQYYTEDKYSCAQASCNCSRMAHTAYTSNHSFGHMDLYKPYQQCYQPNTALLSSSLVLGTFIVAFVMRRLRNSTYFGRKVRRALGDFSLAVAILGMIALDRLLVGDSELTVKLRLTADFTPTDSGRAWLVPLWPVPIWFVAASALAGLLLFMLLFIETEVSQMVMSKKDNCLRKGTGYHWDLLLSAALLVFCAAFGLPFMCAAPVRSQAHLNSLTSYDLRAPGQKPKVSGVLEQRVTALVLSLLIGLVCVPQVMQLLIQIPVAILFGVFLYLGVMNLYGNDMLNRSVLLLVPVKYHPNVPYCLRVRTWRLHVYSLVQLLCFVFVLSVKYISVTSIAFPVAILLAVAARHLLLPLVFETNELNALDGAEDDCDDNMDIYEASRHNRMKTRPGP